MLSTWWLKARNKTGGTDALAGTIPHGYIDVVPPPNKPRGSTPSCSSILTSRCKKTWPVDYPRKRPTTPLCAPSAILRCCAITPAPVGAGTGWRNFCVICDMVSALLPGPLVSRSPRSLSWRSESVPPLHCLRSCARCCSSRCLSAILTIWSWSTNIFAPKPVGRD